eukprot:1451383-Rhodomonas_salina.2
MAGGTGKSRAGGGSRARGAGAGAHPTQGVPRCCCRCYCRCSWYCARCTALGYHARAPCWGVMVHCHYHGSMLAPMAVYCVPWSGTHKATLAAAAVNSAPAPRTALSEGAGRGITCLASSLPPPRDQPPPILPAYALAATDLPYAATSRRSDRYRGCLLGTSLLVSPYDVAPVLRSGMVLPGLAIGDAIALAAHGRAVSSLKQVLPVLHTSCLRPAAPCPVLTYGTCQLNNLIGGAAGPLDTQVVQN